MLYESKTAVWYIAGGAPLGSVLPSGSSGAPKWQQSRREIGYIKGRGREAWVAGGASLPSVRQGKRRTPQGTRSRD
jgi:hypothetical protein